MAMSMAHGLVRSEDGDLQKGKSVCSGAVIFWTVVAEALLILGTSAGLGIENAFKSGFFQMKMCVL